MCGGCMGGGMRTLYDPTPATAVEGNHPPMLVDENGRLLVRLADALDSDLDSVTNYNATIGAHANAWNNVAAAAGTASPAIDILGAKLVSIFGAVSGAETIDVEVSQDGTNWYDSGLSITAAGAGDFYNTFDVAARYIRIKVTTGTTITATIAAKA